MLTFFGNKVSVVIEIKNDEIECWESQQTKMYFSAVCLENFVIEWIEWKKL